ncbi:YcxB-like protein [Micromonospora sp. A202]|nr:YcxB-like protein [Micromonospora sp. A202]
MSARPGRGSGHYRSDVHIRFDVPADPAYPGRVAAALASVRLRRFSYIGATLAAVGAIGVALSRGFSWGEQISPLWVTLIVGGVLSMLYWPWVRLRARRRSSGYAVEGAYDITDANIMMRSGSESGGIAWDGVAQVRDTPDFWIVYVGRMPATVIPRWLMSAEDAETLRAHMAERGLLQHR